MIITQNIEVGIHLNFLHSMSISICIRKYNEKLDVTPEQIFGYFSEI